MPPFLIDILVAAGLVVAMVGSLEAGYRLGRRRGVRKEHPNLATVQGAVLGLLGLLLAFAFSGATSRFIERQDVLVREANALGTAALRAELLPDEQAAALRRALRDYAEARVRLFEQAGAGDDPALLEELHEHQRRIWSAAAQGVRIHAWTAELVLPPVNEVIDLLTTRDSLVSRHLPYPVVGLLVACAALSLATIGYAASVFGRRQGFIAGALAVLIASALWVTIDLDYGRRGLIRVNPQPLLDARDELRRLG
jgi:hypothetical protein